MRWGACCGLISQSITPIAVIESLFCPRLRNTLIIFNNSMTLQTHSVCRLLERSTARRSIAMPFNEIKIDRSFVMKADFDKEAAEIARVTIDLGHSLGLKFVAEGVENEETYKWLKSLGCDVCQGFLVGKPASGKEFTSFIV
ncbi:MAG: EAL domain-containing protein [Halioglobus sp.]